MRKKEKLRKMEQEHDHRGNDKEEKSKRCDIMMAGKKMDKETQEKA